METFAKLFERFLVFVYHCFDRIVIQGYLPLLTRPEHIVHFFRDVHGQYPITPEVLARRTLEYRAWVEGYARNHKIPILKAEKGVSKEECVRPHLQRMERRRQDGVYCIFTSMEMGSTFRSQMPRFPTDDPDYRIIRRVPSRFLHYYFYLRDPVIGPLAMCVGTYLPFQTTYYLNGHNFMEIELRRQGVTFRKDDNAFLGNLRSESSAGRCRQAQRLHHRKAPELLELAPDTEVFGDGSQSGQFEPPLLHQSDRILPEFHLQTELPNP
jgi:hypothetical protein